MTQKSLTLYRQQMDVLRKEQRAVVEEMVKTLTQAAADGYSVGDVLDPGVASPDQPAFDL